MTPERLFCALSDFSILIASLAETAPTPYILSGDYDRLLRGRPIVDIDVHLLLVVLILNILKNTAGQ